MLNSVPIPIVDGWNLINKIDTEGVTFELFPFIMLKVDERSGRMGDVKQLRDKLESLAVEYEGREFTPQAVEQLRQEIEQVIKAHDNEVFFVNGKYQTLEGVEIMPKAHGEIRLLVTWNPTLYHQNYKEVKNYIHNTIGLNDQSFMDMIQIEIQKMFQRMEENDTLSDLFQKEIQKYLGSYKSGIPGHNQQYRIKELISNHVAEEIAKSLVVDIKLKGDTDGQK